MMGETTTVLPSPCDGEKIYERILQEFDKDGIDMEEIAFLMVDLSTKDDTTISYNGFMLLNGLLHENEPVCAMGRDIDDLEEGERTECIKEIQDMVDELSYF